MWTTKNRAFLDEQSLQLPYYSRSEHHYALKNVPSKRKKKKLKAEKSQNIPVQAIFRQNSFAPYKLQSSAVLQGGPPPAVKLWHKQIKIESFFKILFSNHWENLWKTNLLIDTTGAGIYLNRKLTTFELHTAELPVVAVRIQVALLWRFWITKLFNDKPPAGFKKLMGCVLGILPRTWLHFWTDKGAQFSTI